MRIALGLEYDGSNFHGWQKQPNLRTVQSALEKALSKIADQPISVVCAGRTDTGVHAVGQVIHFDTNASRDYRAWLYGVNSFLAKDISVRWVRFVNENFHARFSAMARAYRYCIHNHHIRPALSRRNVSWCYRVLDETRMAEAAEYLVGEHDFSSFRAADCQSRSPIRKLHYLKVNRRGNMVILEAKANAFLHHMVRNIAGVLMAIGVGREEPIWAKEVLEAKDRSLGGVTAPPYGLYLLSVDYPEGINMPSQPQNLVFGETM